MDIVLATIRKKFSDVSHITTDQLSEWLDSKHGPNSPSSDNSAATPLHELCLVDSRPIEEYSVSHIAGTKRMEHDADIATIKSLITEVVGDSTTPDSPKKNVRIVCYCSLGYRSSMLAKRIQHEIDAQERMDQIKIYNLEGSIFKWANENRPMVNNDEFQTVFVHPYNYIFGLSLRKEFRKYH